MTEVSSCDSSVKEGLHGDKGDKIAMFRQGRATRCQEIGKGEKIPVLRAVAVVSGQAE